MSAQQSPLLHIERFPNHNRRQRASGLYGETETMLRELAFALHCTQRIAATIRQDQAAALRN